jgi:hypothetical protein
VNSQGGYDHGGSQHTITPLYRYGFNTEDAKTLLDSLVDFAGIARAVVDSPHLVWHAWVAEEKGAGLLSGANKEAMVEQYALLRKDKPLHRPQAPRDDELTMKSRPDPGAQGWSQGWWGGPHPRDAYR